MVSASPKIGFYQPMYEASVTKQFFDDNEFGAGLSLNRPLYSLRMYNRFVIRKDFSNYSAIVIGHMPPPILQ